MRNGSNNKNGKTKTHNKEPVLVERGSGNVFADLGLADPELELAKATLVHRVRKLVTERKLAQDQAAVLLKLDQQKVAALMSGHEENYTLDRLFKMLIALDQQVEITVTSKVKQKKARPAAVVK